MSDDDRPILAPDDFPMVIEIFDLEEGLHLVQVPVEAHAMRAIIYEETSAGGWEFDHDEWSEVQGGMLFAAEVNGRSRLIFCARIQY